MARATDALIREIVEVDASVPTLTPYINAASAVVDAQCDGITEANGTLVETWLAAHFLCIRDTRTSSEAVSGVSQSFQFKVDLGLNVTMYGQQAMMIDETGGLSKWNKDIMNGTGGGTVGGFWAGTEAT